MRACRWHTCEWRSARSLRHSPATPGNGLPLSPGWRCHPQEQLSGPGLSSCPMHLGPYALGSSSQRSAPVPSADLPGPSAGLPLPPSCPVCKMLNDHRRWSPVRLAVKLCETSSCWQQALASSSAVTGWSMQQCRTNQTPWIAPIISGTIECFSHGFKLSVAPSAEVRPNIRWAREAARRSLDAHR